MLILTRNQGQKVFIGHDIVVKIGAISEGGLVEIKIHAPPHIQEYMKNSPIHMKEKNESSSLFTKYGDKVVIKYKRALSRLIPSG